jgi:hypothetical protein
VQDAGAVVAVGLRQRADFLVVRVHQDESLVFRRDDVVAGQRLRHFGCRESIVTVSVS